MTISTHVLDISIGRPAEEIGVSLYRNHGTDWTAVGRGRTDSDGRIRSLLDAGANPVAGAYRMVFEMTHYFGRRGIDSFYAQIPIDFVIRDTASDYHVPLLVSPFGYSTYRGS